jgi:hypothetical protein
MLDLHFIGSAVEDDVAFVFGLEVLLEDGVLVAEVEGVGCMGREVLSLDLRF